MQKYFFSFKLKPGQWSGPTAVRIDPILALTLQCGGLHSITASVLVNSMLQFKKSSFESTFLFAFSSAYDQ